MPHFYRKRLFLGPEFTKMALGGQTPPGPAGELTALPRPLSCMKVGEVGDGNKREREKKMLHRKQ